VPLVELVGETCSGLSSGKNKSLLKSNKLGKPGLTSNPLPPRKLILIDVTKESSPGKQAKFPVLRIFYTIQ